MKKVLCFVFSVLLFLVPFSNTTFADEQTETICLDSGYTYTITIREEKTSYDSNTRSHTKTASTIWTQYNNGMMIWKVTLTGCFQYNGVVATCIDSSCTTTVYASGWSCSYKTSYESGNQAIGDATMVKKILGIMVDTQNVHLTLVCDKDGNVS